MMDLDVTAVEVAKMTKLQKLAALLIVLGPTAPRSFSRTWMSTKSKRCPWKCPS